MIILTFLSFNFFLKTKNNNIAINVKKKKMQWNQPKKVGIGIVEFNALIKSSIQNVLYTWLIFLQINILFYLYTKNNKTILIGERKFNV